jgi:hypothetical protein
LAHEQIVPPPNERPTMQELAAQSGSDSGIVCPRCRNSAWRVWYTRLGLGIIKRKRKCLTPGCGHEIVTHEKPVGQQAPLRVLGEAG